MDVSGLVGEQLKSVCFVDDFLELGFGEAKITFFAWPYVLLPDFSVAFGEPEYRNALCAQLGEMVAKASVEELDSLTVEFESGTVIALSLREEDLEGPEAGSYSEDGSGLGELEF